MSLHEQEESYSRYSVCMSVCPLTADLGSLIFQHRFEQISLTYSILNFSFSLKKKKKIGQAWARP